MARLHRKTDGGYCIVGPIYGEQGSARICTWQVTLEGLAYLHSRRIEDQGHVSHEVLQELSRRNWIYTGGTAPPGLGDGLSAGDVELLDRLVDWAWDGGVSGFDLLVHHGHGPIDVKLVDRIFSDDFIAWLRGLLGGGMLADLDGISEADFNALAGDRLERLPDALHRFPWSYRENLVVWRLAEIVGKVDWQVATGRGCPTSWRVAHPILGRLFDRLSCQDLSSAVGEPRRRPRRDGRARRDGQTKFGAFLRWDVDDQQIIAILPGRSLAAGQEITWSVAGSEVIRPDVFTSPGGARMGESRYGPLEPAQQYRIRVEPGPGGEVVTEEIPLPPAGSPVVLFSAEGRLLSHETGSAHPEGIYLALTPKPRASELSEIRGVRVLEPVDYEPIGWHDWRGFRLELAQGAAIESYTIGTPGAQAGWQAEDPPDHPVSFESERPVWIGDWPRIWISGSHHFAEAAIEIAPEWSPDTASSELRVWVGEEVAVREEDGRAYLDLSSASELQNVYGPIRLTCRLTALPDEPPLTLDLVRLRPTRFEYVEAPAPFAYSAAVRITTESSEVLAGAGTRMENGEGACLVWPENPLESPSVAVNLPGSAAELRIRTPVTRLRLISQGVPPGPWMHPPLSLRLAEVALSDRLHVELHREPELDRGRPFCRLVGGVEVSAGELCRFPNTYEIRLNRWRDVLGKEAAGTVQLRATRGWIDLVRLEGQGAPSIAPPDCGEPARSPDRLRLLTELATAVTAESEQAAREALDRCLSRTSALDCPAAEREILLLAAARAFLHLGRLSDAADTLERLEGRDDLPERTIIRAALALRRGDVEGYEIARSGKELARLLARCPLQQLVVAEHYSHYASGKGGGLEMWRSCVKVLDTVLRPHAGETREVAAHSIDLKEAYLLDGLAKVMLGLKPAFPQGLPNEGQWRWLPLLHTAASYLLDPWKEPPRHAAPPAALAPPPVFAEKHAELIRLVALQAAGDVPTAGNLLARFEGLTSNEFFAIDLLRLRQCRMENRKGEAATIRRRLLNWARENQHRSLREVLFEEPGCGEPIGR